MDFQPCPSPVSAGELFLNVFSSRFMVWGGPRLRRLAAGKRILCVAAQSCCDSILARASLSFDGAELGWPELASGPLLRSCPRMGPSPNRDAANWKQMVPGRLGLQDEAGWWAHIHTHSHLHAHTMSLTDFNTHTQTLTNTNTHLLTRHLTHIHSLANITHEPAITLSHTYSQINTFTHIPLSLDLTDRHLLFSSDTLNPPSHPRPRHRDHSRACSDPIQFSVL